MEQPALRARSARAATKASFALKATCESCNFSTTVFPTLCATVEAQNTWKVKESRHFASFQRAKLSVGSATCGPPLRHARPVRLISLFTATFQFLPPGGYLALKVRTFLRKTGLALA